MTYLFLDPGADAARRDVYRLAQSLGMGVTLVAMRAPDDPTGVDELIEANPTEPGEVLAATALVRDVEGVVNCSESCLRTQAALVERHGVPGINPETAAVCREGALDLEGGGSDAQGKTRAQAPGEVLQCVRVECVVAGVGILHGHPPIIQPEKAGGNDPGQ